MKEIKAFIRPNMLEAVLRALREHPGLPGVTVSEVRGFGRVAGRQSSEGPGHATVEMAKLECIVDDAQAAEMVEVIQRHATTSRPGDGKIAVYAVESLTRIRTGEPAASAP